MKINIRGPVNKLSYGNVCVNFVHALTQLGHEPALFPINQQSIECEKIYEESIKRSLERAKYYDVDAPCVSIWHQWDLAQFIGRGPHIGFPIFEMNRLTNLEKHHLASCDEVFVCSYWAKKVCEESDIENITVVPLGVDSEIFHGSIPAMKNTVFFNMGKWEIRKGHDVLCKAFNKAFTESDNVSLWMCNDNLFLSEKENQQWKDYYKNSKLGQKIHLLPRVESQFQVAFLMKQATFGVFPARTEGWNLEALELMAVGVPSIITNWAGHTEFCNRDNSLLIPCNELEPAADGVWFKPGNVVNDGEWMKFGDSEIAQLSIIMQNAHEMSKSKDERLAHMREECLKTAQKFSWKNAAQIMINRLSHLSKQNV